MSIGILGYDRDRAEMLQTWATGANHDCYACNTGTRHEVYSKEEPATTRTGAKTCLRNPRRVQDGSAQ
jgi:hypothetical protein